jgi:hypothetical protein
MIIIGHDVFETRHDDEPSLPLLVSPHRALYDAGIIDAGVIITRTQAGIRTLAARLGRPGGFTTTTTTDLPKLEPRMTRGDAGGCPLLAVAITERCLSS